MEKQEALNSLKELLKPGDTVYTDLRHVSRSGMYRGIDVYIIRDNEPRRITYQVAKACGYRYDRDHEALGISGCGMDMGFKVVYDLSHALYPSGYGCIGENCSSNDHSNGDRDYTPHEDHTHGDTTHICSQFPETCTAHTHWHRDGGYALRQKWL